MAEGHLSRRSLLGIGVCGSLALLESTLAGCSRIGPRLASRRGDLPERWVRRLPADWRPQWVEGPAQVLEASKAEASGRPALAQLSDGWATSLSGQTWIPFGQEGVLARLDPSACPASRLFAPEGQPILAFPWSRNPWVLVLRDRPDLAQRADLGWDVLLEPSLAGKVVLPSSPRVVMALVGEDPQRLCRLRRQALALDDRHGINLLLSGPAQAAVPPGGAPASRGIPHGLVVAAPTRWRRGDRAPPGLAGGFVAPPSPAVRPRGRLGSTPPPPNAGGGDAGLFPILDSGAVATGAGASARPKPSPPGAQGTNSAASALDQHRSLPAHLAP